MNEQRYDFHIGQNTQKLCFSLYDPQKYIKNAQQQYGSNNNNKDLNGFFDNNIK